MVVGAFLTFPTYEVQNVTGKLSGENINLNVLSNITKAYLKMIINQ